MKRLSLFALLLVCLVCVPAEGGPLRKLAHKVRCNHLDRVSGRVGFVNAVVVSAPESSEKAAPKVESTSPEQPKK